MNINKLQIVSKFRIHTHRHTIHGSISVSQGQYDVEQVQNMQIYTVLTV